VSKSTVNLYSASSPESCVYYYSEKKNVLRKLLGMMVVLVVMSWQWVS